MKIQNILMFIFLTLAVYAIIGIGLNMRVNHNEQAIEKIKMEMSQQ